MEQKHCIYCMRETVDDVCKCCGKRTSDYNVAPHHLKPGTILSDRYEVGAVLGEGGFGITYIGRDIKLDLRLAIKEYFPSGIVNRNNTASTEISAHYGDAQSQFEKGKKSFLEEARVLAKFSSDPNIVSVRDFFDENNTAYIVMDYLEGIDLKEYLSQNGVMSFKDAFMLLSPIMTSLSKVHQFGLIHRDISPTNIMVIKDGTVKLLDFGAAREVGGSEDKSLSILLKPGYAPEEQYRTKGRQGPWTDVYALSATMYKLVTGVTPEDAMNRIFEDTLARPSSINHSISTAQDDVIMYGMTVQQEKRFQTMLELQQACEKALSENPNAPLWDGDLTISGNQYIAMRQAVSSEPASRQNNNVSADAVVSANIVAKTKNVDTPLKNSEPQGSKEKKPNILFFILSTISGLATLIAMMIFAITFSVKVDYSVFLKVFLAIIMTSFGVGTFFLGKPYYSRLNNKTRKPNIFCFVCSIISTLCVAYWVWITCQQFKESSDSRSISIALALAALIITVFFGYFFYPRLSKKKKSVAITVYGSIFGVAVIIFIFSVVFMSINSLNVGDKKFDKSATSVSLTLDVITDNDLAKLKKLKNLEELYITGCFMDDADVKTIGELTQLKKLSLSLNTDITDVSPLNALKNLTSLDISQTNVKDISCLKDLTKLERLNINGTKVTDVSVIGSYTSLRYLFMNSLSGLNTKTIKLPESLMTLECSNDGIEDLGFIADLKSLSSIVAKNNKISDISVLGKFKSVYKVDFSNNSINDISVLKDLKPQYVRLSHNKISDISAFTDNAGLSDLDLSHNQIIDINPLKDCFKIYSLDLSYNQIEDITAIATIDKLSYLKLRGNHIVDISPLAKAKELVNSKNIDLRNNNISSIQALASFKQATRIYLSNNNITDVSPLASCEALTSLYLNGNKISDISPLAKLTKLNTLEIAGNPISDLSSITFNADSGLFGGTSIAYAYLSVSYNDSIDWVALKEIKKLHVTVYDATARQEDKLHELGYWNFRNSSELDKDEDEGDSNG